MSKRGGAKRGGQRGRGRLAVPATKPQSDLPENKKSARGELELLGSIRQLLKTGVNVNRRNSDGNTLLMVSSNRGHADIVAFLLQHPDIDLDAKNPEGFTALSFASRSTHLPVVASLVGQGADISVLAESKGGRSAKAGLSSVLPRIDSEKTAVLAVATEAAYSYRTRLVRTMRSDDNFLMQVLPRGIIAIIEAFVMPPKVQLVQELVDEDGAPAKC